MWKPGPTRFWQGYRELLVAAGKWKTHSSKWTSEVELHLGRIVELDLRVITKKGIVTKTMRGVLRALRRDVISTGVIAEVKFLPGAAGDLEDALGGKRLLIHLCAFKEGGTCRVTANGLTHVERWRQHSKQSWRKLE